MMLMDVRAIHDDSDYDWALQQIEPYFADEPEPGTAAGDRFDVLASIIAVYEAKRFRIPDADPIELLNFSIDNLGRTRSELAKIVGSKSRVSDILSRKRPLTLAMIQAISRDWDLPLEALAQPYALIRESLP